MIMVCRASKAARAIAKEEAHNALLAEDETKPWYIKYSRKAYRALMHGVDVDIHEVGLLAVLDCDDATSCN